MGETNTKLVDFENFKSSIHANKILKLKDEKMTQLNNNMTITESLKALIDNLKIGDGGDKTYFQQQTFTPPSSEFNSTYR
jgi:hypothetical protein